MYILKNQLYLEILLMTQPYWLQMYETVTEALGGGGGDTRRQKKQGKKGKTVKLKENW